MFHEHFCKLFNASIGHVNLLGVDGGGAKKDYIIGARIGHVIRKFVTFVTIYFHEFGYDW
jgi:hypothetical protein